MNLFKLFGEIVIDNTKANSEIDTTTTKAKKAEKETSAAFEKIGNVAGGIAKGIGMAGAAIGGGFIAAIEGTREYRSEMGLLDSAYLAAGHSSETAKKTYSNLNAVLGETDQSVEAAQHLALVADDEAELSEMTNTLTGVYATFGKSLPLESLAETINHSASLGEVQGSLADALEWSGITVEDFNDQLAECSNEEERQDLIMKTLKDTYGDAAEQYKKTNEDVMESHKAQERLTDAMARLGEIGEPAITAIKNAIADMAEKAIPVLETIIEKVQDGIKWIKENEETVNAWVGVIIGATTAVGLFIAIISWSAIMTKAKNAITVVKLAVMAFNAVLKANPIGIVVSLLAGLVAAFIYLWNNCDAFREFWLNLWENIKKATKDAIEKVKEVWANIGEWFSEKFAKVKESGKEAMDGIKKWFSDAWKDIKDAWKDAVQFFKDIWKGIKEAFSNVKEWIGGVFEGAWNLVKKVWDFYKSCFTGVWNGIKAIFAFVVSFFSDTFQKAWNAIKTVWNAVKGFFKSIWDFIKNTFSVAKSVLTGYFQSALNGVKNIWNGAKSYFSGIWSNIKGVFGSVASWFKSVFKNAWNNIKSVFSGWGSFFSGLWTSIKNKFSSIGSSLGSAMSNAVKSGLNKVLSTIESTINKGIRLINSAIKLANKLPGINVGTVKELSLPRLEEGGILKRGQIGILEGTGAEAVIPLDKNKEWVSNIAEMLNDMQKPNYDNAKLDTIIRLLEKITGIKVILDTNVLVGELSPAINRRLGDTYSLDKRRNGQR